MKVYRIDMMVAATACIKAKSKNEAFEIARGLKNDSPSIQDHAGEIEVIGLRFDDPDLPDVSLSPAMTIHGVWPGLTKNDVEVAGD